MAALSSAAACSVPPRPRMRCSRRMRRWLCMRRASRKLAEERPDRLGAVDVAVLRPEQAGCDLREAGIRKKSGHAMAAIVDAIKQDVMPARAARGDPRDGGLVLGVLVGQLSRRGIVGIAAIELAP